MTLPAALRRGPAAVAGLVGLLVALLTLLPAVPADAHAALRETTPVDGQTVDRAPEQVSLTFNESVQASTGALRVFDGDGERVDTATQAQPAPDTVTIGLEPDLGPGGYVVTFRVTSDDGHVIRGAMVFEVAGGTGVDDDTVAALFAGGGDTVLNALGAVARWAGYAGVLLAGGAVIWLVLVASGRPAEHARARRWARRGALVGAVAAALAVPVQAMLSSGLGVGALTNGTVLGEAVSSSVGIGALLRLVLLVGAVLALRPATAAADRTGAVLTAAGLLTFLIDGHTRTGDPAALILTGDAVHLLAAAAWFGGLVILAGTLRAWRRDDDPVAAADVVARFSGIATWSLIAVTVAGAAMSWALVRQPRALTGTDYGWTLVVKVALVAVVALVGAYNKRRLVPLVQRAATPAGGSVDASTGTADPAPTPADRTRRLGDAAWTQLARTVRFEIVLVVLVLAVTAVLVNLRPAAEEAGITGAFDTTVAVTDELTVNLVVDPNRAGFNEIHLYMLDRTGRPVADLDDVSLELTQPSRDIGPIQRDTVVAGPGHWQLNGRDLTIPGEWVIDVIVGIDRFTEERVEVPVVVNPS